MKGYDHRVVDRATKDIIDIAQRTGARVVGPIPLPTKIERFTVLRSPHVNKESREQFEMRTHNRKLEIHNPTGNTIEKLKNHNLPSGVHITIGT